MVPWPSRSTGRSAISRARPSRRAIRRVVAERAKKAGEGAVLLRAEAPRQPPPLRLPARAQGRPALVGGAQGAIARSEDQAPRHARRGSSVRVRHVRGRHPRGLRRGHRHALGSGHVDAAERRRRRGAEEGRPEVHARRLQAQGIVGAGADRRPLRRRRTRPGAGCSSSTATTGPATSTSRSSRRAASRATATSRTSWPRTSPTSGSRNRPAKGGETGAHARAIIKKAAALKSKRGARPKSRPARQ